ncbi:hypothetical protein [Actinoplanes couchii]|uniref:Lipoprotein n=1 Tax=Actinoplanes couchii TaxID=403638 RepID=A0ABQ3XN58_9ACTN|nr:hypothetical protein [Actinoplanes couchii]MDR6317869.1 hypothetical protein [Actinoplanes couchii]GID59857.1 hypothetical protein Aco03nite_082610 [Actinoplanes couchii]
MRHKRLGLLLSSVAAVALISACDPATESKDAAGTTAPAGQASAPAEVASTAPTVDEATKKACTELLAAIEDTAKRVAAAEKIGPPAGHIAVGAEYIAGSADLSAKSIGASPVVADAATEVAGAMDALDEAYQKDPDKKPSKTALNKAVTGLETACGEG